MEEGEKKTRTIGSELSKRRTKTVLGLLEERGKRMKRMCQRERERMMLLCLCVPVGNPLLVKMS